MIKQSYPFFILSILFSISIVACKSEPERVTTGAEILIEHYLAELDGKRIGLAMNPTSRIGKTHMLDTLMSLGLNVTTLFAAEHGFRGESSDGEIISNGRESKYDLPVYSLYGSIKKPQPEMLEKVDVILFDMQDVGARFYTFYQTLFRIIEAADKNNKQVWVLDRPNPAGGNYIDGWLMNEEFHSFIGAQPMPVAHGLTIGEMGNMAIGEEWIEVKNPDTYKVIKMKGWNRDMQWADTGLEWYAPSPNLPGADHAFIYLGTALFEGTSVSEGRGTDHPFMQFGSPTIDHDTPALDSIMKEYQIEYEFVNAEPREIPGKALNPKYEGQQFKMIKIKSVNREVCRPVELGIDLVHYFSERDTAFKSRTYLNNLAGVDFQQMLNEGNIEKEKPTELESFRKRRNPYLLY